jgi:hypothetical protein
MANKPDFTPDQPLQSETLAELRRRFAQLSITGLFDAYNAAWLRKVERNGRAPRAADVQEFVQAWKELRKVK